MSCWQVVDDIELLRQLSDIRQVSKDEQDNYLLGLKTIYQAKFEKLFDLHEQLIKQQKNLP